MSRFTSMVLAIIMSLSLCASAFAAHDDMVTYDSDDDEVIETELSDTTLSFEAEWFLMKYGVDLDISHNGNAVMGLDAIENDAADSVYVGILNEDILALKNATEAHDFTKQQVQDYVDGLMNTTPQIIRESSSEPKSTRIPDDGIGYEVQSKRGYSQATSYVTLPTRNINNLDDIVYVFFTAYSPDTCMDFGVRGGMYDWVSNFTPVQAGDGQSIGKRDGEQIYFNIYVEKNGWLRCRILDANNFSRVLFDAAYKMSGVKKNEMVFNKQITFCNNHRRFTSGCSITHARFDQTYIYTTTYHTPMNSDNTNPYRRGAFGGSGVRVNYRNGWESEDISIYFN